MTRSHRNRAASRPVTYAHRTVRTKDNNCLLTMNAVVGPYTRAEAFTTSACGRLRPSRQRSMTTPKEVEL